MISIQVRIPAPTNGGLNDEIRAVPGVVSTDTFTYLKICKETFTWGTR